MTGRNWRPRSALWLLGLAVWVGAAYYAGAALGLALKLPHATPSVLWPPNAILTCALLLTPLRLWPLVLLAALPTHILIESGVDGWPMAMIAGLFATNCTEAIIGAATIKWFSDAPTRFDSLKRVGIFMAGAVLAGPLVSSFLDAGIVYLTRGEPYWAVWRARLFANALSELTIVPAVIVTVTSTRAWLRSASRARLLEALVFAALLTVAAVVILDPGQQATAQAVARRAPLVALLPFILWATIRFGPGGTSVTLLLSTLAVVEASVASRGPFEGFSPTDTTRALQLYLIVIAATMLSVAALIEERKLAQQNLSDRLAFEGLLARLSGAFVELPSDRMRAGFDEGLRYVAAFFAADRVRVYQCTHEQSDFVPLSTWPVEDVVTPGMAVHRDFPWSMRQLLLRHSVILERLTDLPPEADIDRQSYAAHGCQSVIAIPLVAGERVLGALTVTLTHAARSWPAEVVAQLQLIAEIFGNALARKQSEDLLRASETMKSSILESLTVGVVVLDRDARVIAVNDRWRQIAGGDASPEASTVGADHLALYRTGSRAGHSWATAAATGIESVIQGHHRSFSLEYEASDDHWVVMRVTPLDRPEGGAVLTHIDVSERKRAEVEAQRMLGELAHVARVATMGALTASVAHQLNQPLTGILANAQAAQRFLSRPSPDLAEVKASLVDIVDDNRRATEVIVRMRELLRKDDGQRADVDVNTIVNNVVRLVASDAVIRNATLSLQLEHAPVFVRGDRVQLQQVVLNLIVNALEAVAERPLGNRSVIVRCSSTRDGVVDLAVIDSGPGFPPGCEESMFEAFYTTKRTGMGMGLSIARSIVEAHGGSIRASNNPAGGAVVSCSLPLASSVAV